MLKLKVDCLTKNLGSELFVFPCKRLRWSEILLFAPWDVQAFYSSLLNFSNALNLSSYSFTRRL